MATGLPDLVDYARLAQDGAVIERVYALGKLPRLQDLLADARGSVRARFAFAKLDSGRAGAAVAVSAEPQLICQRCMQGFAFPAAGGSEIEFASGGSPPGSDRELYLAEEGLVSLRELAEEELLLALPMAAACSAPESCGKAPEFPVDEGTVEASSERTRPFAALQDLLKKT